MEKTVMKPKNNRTPSMNTVNSWSKSQPQRNPKEEQPVINSPRTHNRPVASSVPNQEEDSVLHHKRLGKGPMSRTRPVQNTNSVPMPRTRPVQEGDAVSMQRPRTRSIQEGDAVPMSRPRTRSVQEGDAVSMQRPRTRPVQEGDAVPMQRPRTRSIQEGDAVPVPRPRTRSVQEGDAVPALRPRTRPVQDLAPAPVKMPIRAVTPKNISEEPSSRRVRWGTFPWLSKKVVVTFFATLLALVGGILYLNNTVSVVAIVVNDQHFGYTTSMNESQGIIDSAIHTLGEEKIENINTKTDDKIIYVPQRVDKKTFDENQASADDIAQYVTAYIPGFAISVNDQEVMVLSSQEEAEGLLEEIKAHYADVSDPNNAVSSVVFEENISVVESKAQPLDIKTKKQALQALIDGNTQNIDYTVTEGETIWEIAQKHNVTIDSIAAENKGLNVESDPAAGTLIKVVTVQPYLNVVVVGVRVATENIEFDTETKKDATIVLGTISVKQEGELGSKDVTYSYISKNGVIKDGDKIIVQEKTTKEAVAKVVHEGTGTARLASGGGSNVVARGSGVVPSMMRPCDGSITSRFRTASRPNHTGIDIANPVGTPIYASASGTVVLKSWSGGYGNCILVDHGNGVATRYAHLSSYNVTLGQVVNKGDNIGGMGNTGNSSGSHLHFEVIINGTCYNPEGYI